jgi:hypothetical protein
MNSNAKEKHELFSYDSKFGIAALTQSCDFFYPHYVFDDYKLAQ